MAHKIFLNYRRDDADAWADRLHERLSAHFGAENVFLDVEGRIPVGMDFVDHLGAQVAECDAMVTVIGRRWLEENEARALSGEPDFVRIEIEAALAREIAVAPALVGGAVMPRASALPETLRPLARRQALSIGRGPDFDPAMARLIAGLETAIALSKGGSPPAQAPQSSDAKLIASPAGTVFCDALKSGGEGPQMCVIPAGRFLMGSPADEAERESWKPGVESPQHEVTIARPFALGRCAVTFEEFDAFCAATGVAKPSDQGWGRGQRPAINLSWEDAEAYCRWLSEQAGAEYCLPTETEWEYACRAGTATPFWWGRDITPDRANFRGSFVYEGGGEKGVYRQKTEPVDAFEPNPWGLYQTHGNVWEWCQDCWNDSYQGAPSDGSAWMSGDCSRAVLRGGSWISRPRFLRSANRGGDRRGIRADAVGFRLARTLRE